MTYYLFAYKAISFENLMSGEHKDFF